MTTEERIVHVRSYYKKDGTFVREHDRHIEVEINNLQNMINNWNGLNANTPPENSGQTPPPTPNPNDDGGGFNWKSVLMAAARIALQVVPRVIDANNQAKRAKAQYMQKAVAQANADLARNLAMLKSLHNQYKTIELKLIDSAANATTQEKYSKIYKDLIKVREQNQKNSEIITKIEHSQQAGDNETINTELGNYVVDDNPESEKQSTVDILNPKQLDFSKFQNQNVQKVDLPYITNGQVEKVRTTHKNSFQPEIKSANKGKSKDNQDLPSIYTDRPYIYAHKSIDIGKEIAQIELWAITLGMKLIEIFMRNYNAKNMWNIAAFGPENTVAYIIENGYIIGSIKFLPINLKLFIRNYLKTQYGNIDDAFGIIFSPESDLAKKIARHLNFKLFMQNNILKLLKGEILDGSVNFNGHFSDTHYSLGLAAIRNMYIDQNGYLNALVIDTYDFNKSKNLYIKMARNVQEHGLLRPYYSITVLKIPKSQWLQYLKINR